MLVQQTPLWPQLAGIGGPLAVYGPISEACLPIKTPVEKVTWSERVACYPAADFLTD